jgi:hypothetical protein
MRAAKRCDAEAHALLTIVLQRVACEEIALRGSALPDASFNAIGHEIALQHALRDWIVAAVAVISARLTQIESTADRRSHVSDRQVHGGAQQFPCLCVDRSDGVEYASVTFLASR